MQAHTIHPIPSTYTNHSSTSPVMDNHSLVSWQSQHKYGTLVITKPKKRRKKKRQQTTLCEIWHAQLDDLSAYKICCTEYNGKVYYHYVLAYDDTMCLIAQRFYRILDRQKAVHQCENGYDLARGVRPWNTSRIGHTCNIKCKINK